MSEGFTSKSDGGMTHPLPRVFGRLLLLKLMARGGMGDVYLAATTGIEGAERACVVKTVRRDHIHDGSFLARFLDEARVQAQLNHPGVAQVLEAATDENGEPFTVVEYVEGRSLADLRQRAVQLGVKIGWADAVAIAVEMAQALHHVHGRAGASGQPLGIVHRDLSPQNVMVGYAGEVKLIDFGTARGQNRRCHTVAGVVFAKPGYVAPEVARQQVGDGRIDIYALGIMLWELCKSGRFLTGDPQKHLEATANGETHVPPIASKCGAPPELDDVIARLTANDPDARYTNGAEAASELARLLTQAPAGASGERSVRGRVSALMLELWPREPSASRAEFAKLLKGARGLLSESQSRESQTPTSARAAELAKLHSDDPDVLPGTPYRVGKKLGEGASGTVHEAEHVELGRKVALKILAPAHASAKDAIDRFRREARAVANLSHKNLVALHDFGKSLDGRVFLAMELLSGETLEKRLDRTGGMDWREAAAVGIEVCRALEAAHHAGLVHRDLKPANLFMTDGGAIKLLDFGVAMALADVATCAKEKRQKGFAIFGTPEYMSPEQVAGEGVDGRCDIYALGAVLYELVSGTAVFDGPSAVVIMGKQLREAPESPRVRAPQRAIPRALDALILCALAKAPTDRFASASAMREALEAVVALPLKRRERMRRWAGIAAGAAVAGLSALAFAGGSRWAKERATDVAAMLEPRVASPTVDAIPPSVERDIPMSLPLPTPPTASPDPSLPVALRPTLPPLPTTKGTTGYEAPHAADGHDTRPDVSHVRRLHHAPGLETVSHKTPAPKH
jgi:serine/threonine protein kinase